MLSATSRACARVSLLASRDYRTVSQRAAEAALRLSRKRVAAQQRSRPAKAGCSPVEAEQDLAARASELGVSLSHQEMQALAVTMARPGRSAKGGAARHEFRRRVRELLETEHERQALAEFILKSDERTVAQRALTVFDMVGCALFAMVGTLLGGD